MKLSIGIPVHNAVDCALRAIDRVLWAAQTNGYEVELIVIDDNSTFETHERLKERLRLLDSPYQLLKTQDFTDHPAPNLGFNVNRLLDHIDLEADYYLNLETDVFVSPETLRLMVERMDTDESICATFPAQLRADRQSYDFFFCERGYPKLNELPEDLQRDRDFDWTHFGCLLVRGKDARDRHIRVDESFILFCADQDYTSRLKEVTTGRIVYVASAYAIHIGHVSSMEGQKPNPDPECFERVDAKWGNK
jgi:GT2 family glycosyltransferase